MNCLNKPWPQLSRLNSSNCRRNNTFSPSTKCNSPPTIHAKFIPIFAVFIKTAIWAKGTITPFAPPNSLSWSGAIHACRIAATLTITIIYGAAFVTQDFVTVITQTHWLATVAYLLTATITRKDWATFAAEQLLAGPTKICVALSTEAVHALIACEFLQAILVHPFLSFAAPTDALTALKAINPFFG